MDLILDYADRYALDSVWAALVPVSAFADSFNRTLLDASAAALNASSRPILLADPAASTWSHIVSHFPHPPLPADLLSPAVATLPAVSAWPRDYWPRQFLSLAAITLLGIHLLYFIFAYLSYRFIFNHDMMKHPKFLKDQVRLEIISSLKAFPLMTLLTLPFFMLEVKGYSKMYNDVNEYGWGYLIFSIFLFLVFTDYCIYWIHRWEHHPICYKWLHKPHHKWLVPSPFASHAFHPLDGYAQSLPYHIFPFIFPLHQKLFLGLFIFIHDSDMITGHPLETVINGPAHHTLHHLYFTVNYGQYFTLADRLGKSYRQPEAALDPMLDVKKAQAAKKK
ncbi:hypothetical protein EIP86_007118 [Pleurotus ostreatoroseus]|nr:hypothetical protein EIP86_007118 [Pleurotus ostreatoroseus]